MSDQRRRRWADVVQMSYKCFVVAGSSGPTHLSFIWKCPWERKLFRWHVGAYLTDIKRFSYRQLFHLDTLKKPQQRHGV